MQTELLVGVFPLAMLGLAIAASLAVLLLPLRRRYPDDRGDGNALVLLDPPRNPPMLAAPAAVTFFACLFLLYRSVQGPLNVDHLYATAVDRIASTVVRAPSEVHGYLAEFSMGLRFLIVGTMLTLAIFGRGGPVRRIVMVAQAIWYVCAVLFIDAALVVVEVLWKLPTAPAALVGGFVVIGLSFVAMTRLLFLNIQLPKPSSVPFVPRRRSRDAVTLVVLTVASMAICFVVVLLIYQAADPTVRLLLPVLLPIPFTETVFVLRSVLLGILTLLTKEREPAVGEEAVPIDVIIPAWNEQDVIVDTLQAIDWAAAHHDGAVTVYLTDDGSTDRTRELATQTMEGFRYATGYIVAGAHGGKSAALNLALARTTADIVIRIDADTLIGKWALHYTPRWFRDPQIGLVEAMMISRWRRSRFARMRLFEELKQFGLNHRTIDVVDGVNVVPGVFTAFRREVATALGGFTVGMNGEDGDFTLRFSRMGYRSHLDPRIVVGEDVPATYRDIREQRIRWSRATFHNQARHGPYRAGVGTPKVWFSQTHQYFTKTFAPIRLMFYVYLVLTAAVDGTYRDVLLVFVGAWVVFSIVFSAIEALLCVGYGQTRHIGWVVLWPIWQLATTLWTVESWLSLPARPLVLRKARAPLTAVVH